MDTTVLTVSFPENKRVLVLSDPHAHREGFMSVLKQANFTKEDILVIVGDILEKGPDSLGLVREILHLAQTHAVYTLMGNVDYWRLTGLLSDDVQMQRDLLLSSIACQKWWPSGILVEMLSELGIPMTEEMDTRCVFAQIRKHFEKELSFLCACPAIVETQNKIFVHGGIPHENLAELIREDRHRFMKRDRFMTEDVSFQKTVVVGHWPVTLYSKSCPNAAPVFNKEKNILSIDGGCGIKKEGQINLLIFPSCTSMDYELITWDGLPTVQALDAQTGSVDCGYIRWSDDEVTVIENNGETSKVRFHERVMAVPTKDLYQKDGVWHASEFTDYLLPVLPGDTLRVITQTPNGLYAKKGSISGWYMGRYQ